jgi:hypothetical protein
MENLQTITGNIILSNGQGAAGAMVSATLSNIPQAINSELISTQVLETTVSDKFFVLQVLKGAVVLIIAKDAAGGTIFRKSVTVTTDDTKDISTYL